MFNDIFSVIDFVLENERQPSIPLKLKVSDKNGRNDGTYELYSKSIDGKPIWIRNDNHRAIWYYNNSWRVGLRSNLGSRWSFYKAKSTSDGVLPADKSLTWSYRPWVLLNHSNQSSSATSFSIDEINVESVC